LRHSFLDHGTIASPEGTANCGQAVAPGGCLPQSRCRSVGRTACWTRRAGGGMGGVASETVRFSMLRIWPSCRISTMPTVATALMLLYMSSGILVRRALKPPAVSSTVSNSWIPAEDHGGERSAYGGIPPMYAISDEPYGGSLAVRYGTGILQDRPPPDAGMSFAAGGASCSLALPC
jgi:hypothetical protein